MSANQPNYLRRDLITLAVVVVIVASVLVGLWYADQRSGAFTTLAQALLDSPK